MDAFTPVWSGYFADPMVLRVGDEYFAYGTDGPDTETGRRFPVLFSRDLEHWDYLGGALEPSGDADAFWAPEVAYKDARFYLYYSCGGREGQGHRLRVALSDRPEGPFHDACDSLVRDEPFSIDASPFLDPVSGEWFLYFAKDFFDDPVGTGIAGAQLEPTLTSLCEDGKPLLRAGGEWQVFERNRTWYDRIWPTWHTVEGPFVVHRDGRYWMFYSGGCWKDSSYGVGCAVASSPMGPFKDDFVEKGPSVLQTRPGELDGPGHCSVVVGPDGRDCLAFHAWNKEATMRQMHLAPLEWTSSGSRVVG